MYLTDRSVTLRRIITATQAPVHSVVTVVGAGTMGRGIAEVALAVGERVVVIEQHAAAADAARSAIGQSIHRSVKRGRYTQAQAEDMLQRCSVSTNLSAAAGSSLVIEAVIEDLDAKRQLFDQLEAIVDDDCVLATNTSSHAIESIARDLRIPSRLGGLHFFNPATSMKLVEAVRGLNTSQETISTIERTAGAWGKQVVVCPSTPGFLVNRLARAFYSESLAFHEETGAPLGDIDAVMRECGGFRMGPFELMDLIGNDINLAVTQSVWRGLDLDPRNRPSALQQRLVESGKLGRKTGQGFYAYPSSEKTPAESESPPAFAPKLVQIGRACPFGELLLRFAPDAVNDDALGTWADIDGTYIGITDGKTASEHSADRDKPVILLDLALSWSTTTRIGWTAALNGESVGLDLLLTGLAATGIHATHLPDSPGLLLARTIAVMVDEAVSYSDTTSVAAELIDTAMQLGVNYPRGPIEWLAVLGAPAITSVLDHLHAAQPDGKFRVSPALRRMSTAAQSQDLKEWS